VNADEHIAKAQQYLELAEDIFEDDSDDAGPREDYASEEAYFEAVETSNELAADAERATTLFAALAQAHATIAAAITRHGLPDQDRR
jgi:hypothetical protein